MRYLRLAVLAGGLLALSRCGDSESPAVVAGPPFFTAKVDGTTWPPDTSSCFVLITSTGTVSGIAASRLVSPQQSEEIMILFPGFPAKGQFPLDHQGGPASGHVGLAFFTVSSGSGGLPLQYVSMDAQPGLLSITGVNLTDSLMTGTFSFQGARTPDTASHRVVTGQFRIRYEVAQP